MIYEIINNNYYNYNTKKSKEVINGIPANKFKKTLGYYYINKGYRINYTFQETLRSLFTWHNETINIWTHL